MIDLLAVGDVAFVGALAEDPVGVVDGTGEDLKALLKKGLLLANLECVLYDDVKSGQQGLGNCPMHSPTRAVEALQRLGVEVVSLANNHIMDYGRDAIQSTIRVLDEAGIAHFGAGLNFQQAAAPAVVERGGLRVGFVGFAQSQYPTQTREGTIPVSDAQARKVVSRCAGEVDFLVACIHEGIEGLGFPMRSTVKAARNFVEAGTGLGDRRPSALPSRGWSDIIARTSSTA
jgi:poly-gamma-glutamate capsule biosynthesis protein CapA/YwtB (metallophosphatase superfamily)